LSRLILLALLAALLYVASLVVLPVEEVRIVGVHHLKETQVENAVGVYPGDPWLWVGSSKLTTLLKNPWVLRASLSRPKVGLVVVKLVEREAVATLTTPQGKVGLAADATPLPGAKPVGPLISGFGRNRLREALQIAALLPAAESISYDPTGFTVNWEGRRLWIRSVSKLRAWLSRVNMMHGKDIAIYSWGVSVRQ